MKVQCRHVIQATENVENLLQVLMLLLGVKSEAVIKIKTKREALPLKVTRDWFNRNILRYLFKLKNEKHLIYENGTVEFPPYGLRLRIEKMSAEIIQALNNNIFGSYAKKNRLYELPLEKYDEDKRIVSLNHDLKFAVITDDISYFACINTLNQVFVEKEYEKFYDSLEGKTVLDIGAFIGGTAVSFSRDGARIICAYEPDPVYYDLAVTNLKLNDISNVRLFNVGIGEKKNKMTIDRNFGRLSPTTIEVIPLAEVLKEVGTVDFLKIDCEGCEFPALLSLNRGDLHRIREMILEYHGIPDPIVEKLKSVGFNVKVEEPSSKIEGGVPIGLLHAVLE